MNDKVRVGVVSTSWWADQHHLPCLKSHPGAEVAAVCGRHQGRAEQIAKKYDVPGVFTDYREMIDKGGLDALVVAVPDDGHYTITMAALTAGLHVACEKPLASNLDQAMEMTEKADEAGVKHMTCFTWRWLPHYQYIKSLIQEGRIGDSYHCHMNWMSGIGRGGDYLWRFDNQRADGILGDIGSHMIDLAQWYMGDVAKVTASLKTHIQRPGRDGQTLDPANDAAQLLLEFENGAQGAIHASAVAHIGNRMVDQQARIYGSSGTIEADCDLAGAAIRATGRDRADFEALPVPDKFLKGLDGNHPFGVFSCQSAGGRRFIDAILEDLPLSPSFHDGLKVQNVIEAAKLSAQNGACVPVAHLP